MLDCVWLVTVLLLPPLQSKHVMFIAIIVTAVVIVIFLIDIYTVGDIMIAVIYLLEEIILSLYSYPTLTERSIDSNDDVLYFWVTYLCIYDKASYDMQRTNEFRWN